MRGEVYFETGGGDMSIIFMRQLGNNVAGHLTFFSAIANRTFQKLFPRETTMRPRQLLLKKSLMTRYVVP